MLSKRVISIFAFIFITLIVLSSCAPSAVTDPEATADLTIVASIPDSRASRTIQPGIDSVVPDRLVVELSGSEDKIGDFTYEDGKESYTLTNVKVGSYTIKVTGYASYEIAGEKTDAKVMYGESSYTVTASGANSCRVELEFGTDGTGAISAMITWTDLASGNSPVADAMRNGSIGFLAYYTKNNEPVIGEDKSSDDLDAIIHWVDDAEAGEYQYFEDKIPATGKVAEDIYFLIYTKDADWNISVVGKTFYSTLTVYSNVISIPDKNELYNFHLDSSNVQGYLLNVTHVNASHSETDPSGTLIVTWKNPDFSDNVYPMTVTVTLKEETEEANGYSAVNDVEFKTEASEGRTEFKGLDPNKTYSIYFKINGAIGYSLEELKFENARTQGVTAIAFKSEIAESYTVGDTVTVTASITPSAADQSAFTIIETNSSPDASIDNEAHTITFNKHGDYSFKLVAREKESIESDVKTTTVRLNAPLAVEAEAKDNVEITWDAVENATGYKIYRNGSAEPINTVSENKYTDTATIAGETYTYSVAASAGDAKYDSEATASNEVTTAGAFISIELPKLPKDDISSYLEPVRGKYINPDDPDKEKNSFSIGLSNPIEGAKEYIWLLNDKEIQRTNNYAEASVEISSSTKGFLGDSDYNPNTLVLRVETADGTCSGSVNFYVIKGELKTLESFRIGDGDGRVVFGNENAEELIPVFSADGTIEPVVTWSASPEGIVEITEDGKVNALKMGDATITASVDINGEIKSLTQKIKSYIPVGEITIGELPHTEMILSGDSFPGVEIVDTSYSSQNLSDYLTIIGKNGEAISKEQLGVYSSSIIWESSNTNALSVNNGVVSTGTVADTAVIITAKSSDDSAINDTVAMQALKVDILCNNAVVTGKEGSVGSTWTGHDPSRLNLSFSNDYITESTYSSSEFKNDWCLDGEIGKLQTGGAYSTFTISNSGFTATATRKALADNITVSAVLQEKDTLSRIAVLSFTAVN